MRRLMHFTKQAVSSGLYFSGLLSLIARIRLRNRIPVLMYHRVIDDQHAPLVHSSSGIVVSKDVFEMQMAAVRQWFNPITIEDFVNCVRSGRRVPDRSCLVTFDDGWIDNYEIALPILRQFDIPAVVFLPTHYVSADRMFWQEELLVSMTTVVESSDANNMALLRQILESGGRSYEISADGIRSYITDLKTKSDADINIILENVRRSFSLGSEADHYNRFLTWPQIKKMLQQGFSFGSHAITHRALDKLSEQDCRNELRQSREAIEEKTAMPVSSLAYPNGNHDPNVVREARDAGYEVAFTTIPGLFDQNADPLRVPRINIHDNNSSTKSRFLCAAICLF